VGAPEGVPYRDSLATGMNFRRGFFSLELIEHLSWIVLINEVFTELRQDHGFRLHHTQFE